MKRIRSPRASWVVLVLATAISAYALAYSASGWPGSTCWAEWYIRRTAHAPVPDAEMLRVA